MRNKMNRITVILAAAAFGVTGCGDGAIPVLKTYIEDNDLAGIRLPEYTPPSPGSASASISPRYEKYGTEGTRINPPGLYIKNTYKTSDDVIHIVLSGKIENGIPEGLLWNTDPAGTLGVPSGSYAGRGDIRVGALPDETGGSMAIGGLDFSAEWVMAGPYTAVVIDGLISDKLYTTVIERNESLNLFSSNYRRKPPDNSSYKTSPDGKLQKRNDYTYNPNDFMPWPDSWEYKGDPRGGYLMLISKSEKAVPYTAFFDIEYSDGAKKRFEVDYSGVELREDIHLEPGITGISFQNPTPPTGSVKVPYTLDDSTFPDYNINSPLRVDHHAITLTDPDPAAMPLLLRPIYDPQNTTNMIKNVYLTGEDDNPLNYDNLILTWDDRTQAINLYIDPAKVSGKLLPPDETTVKIHAVLQKPSLSGSPDKPHFEKLTCTVTIY
jgi:hypothetical protein